MLSYLKEHGLKHTLKVIYQYKIDVFLIKLINMFTQNKPLKNVIMIESHNDFDCNGGPFYDYLIAHGYHEHYKIIWLLKNPVPKKLPKNVKGYMIKKPSFMKDYYRCVAKISTADNLILPKVRKDQKIYYLTHGGITFKNVRGLLDVPDEVDYILSSSESYDPLVCDNYSIPYPNQKMLHFGYPSNDCFFQDIPDEMKKISNETYQKVILWMPTFRKGGGVGRNDSTAEQPLGIPLIDKIEQYQELNEYLRAKQSFMIIKLHPFQELSDLKITDMSNIKVVTGQEAKKLDLDSNRMMKSADAFISDYSSAAYQYLLLNRPLAFVLSDLEAYKPGFSVENIDDYLPGEKLYCYEDMITFLEHVILAYDTYRSERMKLLNYLYEYQDGDSCKRLVDFMNL